MKLYYSTLLTGVLLGCGAQAQTTFPADFDNTSCPVDQTMLNGWFDDGTAVRGGKVKPADSLIFPPVENTKCDFYRWGAQMFLWLTSPAEGSVVFDSTQFYDVVPSGSGLAFEDNAGPAANTFALRARKGDAIGGTGQAGGDDVLISQPNSAQKNSLTYYGMHANDLYAEYLTGQKAGAFANTDIDTNFPISDADMQLIEDYVGSPLRDPQAMTMELKTSWVDASTVDASQFVTLVATVPAFDRSSDTAWPMTDTEEMTLALVGLHIAAPVQGHPELVWSSFEHISAAPTAPYYYINSSGDSALAQFDSAGNWVFFPSGAAQPPSVLTVASWNGDTKAIEADEGATISAVSVVQENPWGLSPGDQTVLDTADPSMDSNTNLVNLNANVLGALQGLGDVRGNYLQIGGIWTVKGQLPTGGGDANIRGGTRLANATMETFHQYPDENNGFTTLNCLDCHNNSRSKDKTTGLVLSHIYSHISPLTK